MTPEHLKNRLPQSLLKEHERGIRRYFPIEAKNRRGWKWINQAFFIIYGRQPEGNSEAGFAILSQSLDKYVEKFDGKLWVRTTCV